MARSVAGLALLACLVLFTGCDHEARVATRNTVEAAKFIEQKTDDPSVRKAAQAIVLQSTAVADQLDIELWGLWESRSKATVLVQDWAESPASSLRRSEDQAKAVEEETEAIKQFVPGMLEALLELLGVSGLTLTGGGTGGLIIAGLLKHRKTLLSGMERAARYAEDVSKVKPEEVEDVKKKYKELPENPVLKKVLAKIKKEDKVS